jgi:hypothetical protein
MGRRAANAKENDMRIRLMATVIIVACLAVVAIFYWPSIKRALFTPVEPLPVAKVSIPERPMLETVPMSEASIASFTMRRFSSVGSMEGYSRRCLSTFASAFPGQHNASELIAGRGEKFQVNDALVPGLPFRRFIFGGEDLAGCFLFYQHGGVRFPRFCLVLIKLPRGEIDAVVETRKPASNLNELRTLLLSKQYSETAKC